jgi:carboxylesterase
MESYEVLNRALMPLDRVIGASLEAARKAGVYEPLRGKLTVSAKRMLRKSFDHQYQLEVVEETHIPATGGCLIAPNHRSWLDVQVLAVATKRQLHFVAKAEFKHWPILRRMIEVFDGLYVQRGGASGGLDEIIQAVRDGKVVVMFPEGTIPGEESIPRWDVESTTGLLRGHSGIVRVAMATGAPIIPCGISGTGLAFPPEAYPRMELFPPLPRSAPVTVRFGKPLHFHADTDVGREELARRTHHVMQRISELVDFSRDYVPIQVPVQTRTKPGTLPPYAFSRSPQDLKRGHKAPLGVLVLHGFTSDIHCVDPLVAPLDTANLPYRLPILRGHGTLWRDLKDVTHRDWYADGENALLDLWQECEQVVVVGLSMGGLVALELAARHRDKVAGVAVLAPALKFADPLAFLTPALAKVVPSWPSPNAYADQGCRKREDRNYKRFPTATFASLLDYAREVSHLLSFVKAPMLVLGGRRDKVVAASAQALVRQKASSKDKQVLWLDKSGHELLLDAEAPVVVEAVMAFVRRIREQSRTR